LLVLYIDNFQFRPKSNLITNLQPLVYLRVGHYLCTCKIKAPLHFKFTAKVELILRININFHFKFQRIMKRSNVFSFGHSAQRILNAEKEAPAACGSACGAGDKEEKPAACGSACGAGDK
jgi:ACGX-repeat protein